MHLIRVCLAICISLVGYVNFANAGSRNADYVIRVASVLVSSGGIDSTFGVKLDSSMNAKAIGFVSHDSLEFSWKRDGQEPSLEFFNRSGSTVVLAWDSSSALDTEGRRLELIPFERGMEIGYDFRVPPKKVNSGKKYKTKFMCISRANELIQPVSILVLNDDYLPGSRFDEVIGALKSRTFSMTLGVLRGTRLVYYQFVFKIEDVKIR